MTIELDDTDERAPVEEGPARRSVELELCAEFPSVPIDQVTILVECLWAHFDDAPVRDFVPVLVRKQAKEELREHLDRQHGGAEPWLEASGQGVTRHHREAATAAGRRRRLVLRHLMLRG